MKTGWQMEWENEVRYFAPLRAEINTRAEALGKAFEPWRRAVQKFGISMREASMNMQKFGKQLELFSQKSKKEVMNGKARRR